MATQKILWISVPSNFISSIGFTTWIFNNTTDKSNWCSESTIEKLQWIYSRRIAHVQFKSCSHWENTSWKLLKIIKSPRWHARLHFLITHHRLPYFFYCWLWTWMSAAKSFNEIWLSDIIWLKLLSIYILRYILRKPFF